MWDITVYHLWDACNDQMDDSLQMFSHVHKYNVTGSLVAVVSKLACLFVMQFNIVITLDNYLKKHEIFVKCQVLQRQTNARPLCWKLRRSHVARNAFISVDTYWCNMNKNNFSAIFYY